MAAQTDHYRLPKRSASHGTLRSSYASPSGSVSVQPPFRPLHKPLRSVNENSVLLPSPGALESMLKTTTETGDIGIFSIKPRVASPERGALSDLRQLSTPRAPRSVDSLYGREPRYRLPGTRDTTSEILSMYTSDSQKSVASTLTPPSTEDMGPRSYSMTTCGSRHLSHHKSTATLQSHASGGPLQRPRSPFPYPTRLKRPGVRPASPALTETGRVDYSRMVEIDRISLRTVHGPYKPVYPLGPRRPLPLGIRTNANLASPCVPGQHTFPGRSLQWSIRTPSAASMASWSGPLRSPLDNDPRTASLTSLVTMQRKLSLGLQASQSCLPLPPPRYYDYTEEFEPKFYGTPPGVSGFHHVASPASIEQHIFHDEPETLMLPDCNRRDSAFFDMESQQTDVEDESIQTDVLNVTSTGVIDLTALAQCPTRASSALSCEHGSSHKRQRVFRASDIDLLPSQIGRDSVDTFNPALDVESQDTLASGYNKFCMAETPQMTGSTPERQVEVQLAKTPTIRSEQGVILRDELQEEPLTEPASDPILYIQEKIEETQPPSEAEDQKRRTCSLPDGDLATKACQKKTATNVHRYATVNTLLRIDQPHSGDEITSHDAGSGGEGILPGTKSDKSSVQTEQAVAKDREMGPRALEKQLLPLPEGSLVRLRRHKRNLAALRISTSNLLRGVNEGYPHLTPSCSTAPLLAPKPISPARQLKVKNSIPRLMKALPPIPGDPDFVPSVESNALDEEDDFLEILAPLSLSGALAPRSLRKKDPVKLDLVAATSHTTRSNLAQPRLRVKMKSSDKSAAGSSSEHNPWPLCDADTATVSAMPPGQTLTPQLATPRRLKIRSARGTRSHSPIQSTVRRDPAQESDVGASLAKLSKHDLFVGGSPSNTRTRPRVLKKALPGDHIRVCSSSGFMASSKTESLAMMKRASKDGVKDTAFSSGRPHRLKKRLSNMKTLLSGPHEHHWHPIDRATARSALPYRKESSPGDDNMTVRSVETGKSEAIRRNLSPPLASRTHIRRRVRIRLSRWVKGAKTAVKSYTKKSHSL